MGAKFTIPAVVFEGIETGDKRIITPGALTTRALPLTLMGMLVNPEMGGHGLAVVAGRIDTLERYDAAAEIDEASGKSWGEIAGGPVNAWRATGEFADTAEAQQVQALVEHQTLRGVSVDLGAAEVEEEVLEEDEEGWPTDWLVRVTAGEIAAATVCSVPAFRGASIILDGQAETPAQDDAPLDEDEDTEDVDVEAALAAAALPAFRVLADGPGCAACPDDHTATAGVVTAAGGPLRPPAAWFTDPGLDVPTPLTVDDDGRIYGHLAAWGTCHTGYPGQCVTPPRSNTDYALFHLGAVRTADGDDMPVGHITMGTGHAGARAGMSSAVEHYDNTGTVVADVHAGEDAHGIWVAGAVRPTATDEQVQALRASKLSGDWRAHGGRLELMAALAVNVPGFPIVRPKLLAASGAPVSLVAAGASNPALTPAAQVDAGTAQAAVSAADQLGAALRFGQARARAARADRRARWS